MISTIFGHWKESVNIHTVTAMCTAGGPAKALRCQPRFDIASPTSKTLRSGRFEANATTEAGGDPRTYMSGISVRMASAILRVVVTIDRQDSRYPLYDKALASCSLAPKRVLR